jgi:type I restriction enzyme M protein
MAAGPWFRRERKHTTYVIHHVGKGEDRITEALHTFLGYGMTDHKDHDGPNVPLAEKIDGYLRREVLPHFADAWVDATKTKIGYEIPFTRHFYCFTPPRPLAEIDAELDAVEAEIQQVLRGVAR